MNLTDLLKDKVVLYMTDALVEVELTIKTAEEVKHSRDLEPSTRENDWWPASESWRTVSVVFTNGFRKSYGSLSEIKLKE